MTQAAVEDRPTTQTDPTTVPDIDPTTAIGTGDDGEAQPGPDDGEDTTGESSTPASSGRAARVSALKDAEREQARQEGYEAAHAELVEKSTVSQSEQRKNAVKTAFAREGKLITDTLDMAINEGRLTTDEKKTITDAYGRYHSTGEDGAYARASEEVMRQTLAKLPKSLHEEFNKATTNPDGSGVDLGVYWDTAVEMAALNTKAVKSLDLETALKSSTKLKKQIAERDIEQYDKGYEDGLVAPPGTSPDGGRSTSRTAPGLKSFIQLQDGYNAGTNTREQDAEYRRQKQARDKAR